MGESAEIRLTADVLVLGGGPSGAWAAWSAAKQGAKVILADKGYLGTSGATAPGGTNLLYLPPDQAKRDAAVEDRLKGGGYLSEADWIYRVMEQVYINMELVAEWGYPFPKDADGNVSKAHLHGPEYMHLMRRVVAKAGVRILDQHPAQELLQDDHGVAGARGISRLDGRTWEVRAGAVVIATGGCAFLSKGLGCNVLTGDGLLMASELGADLSGMEFSRQYAPSAAFGTVTRGRLLGWASFYDGDGQLLHDGTGGPRGDDFLARMLRNGPVYATLDQADTEEKRRLLRQAHPVFFLPYDRSGIDPFTERFPLTLRYEGTVRGTGGIRIIGKDCSTSVPGLFAAGDAASREKTAGARTGGGAYNASWAICSGTWAGQGAAEHARLLGSASAQREGRPAGQYGLASSARTGKTTEVQMLTENIRREVLPLEINYFRSVPVIQAALDRLNALWPEVHGQPPETVQGKVRAREAAAMAATARWMYTAALARTETRGMHTLAEHPAMDPDQAHRLLVSGVEQIKLRKEAVLGGRPSPAVEEGRLIL
jgi:Succinate dehydrogenase/fumarate reductase, flavoprotein subunit